MHALMHVSDKVLTVSPHARAPQVSVCGQACTRAIALHARGGFRMALPSQLEEQWEQYKAVRGSILPPPGVIGGAGAAAAVAGPAALVPAPAPVIEWASPGLPGVMEAVSMAFDLAAAGTANSEQYVWFSSVVALDDSCGKRPFRLLL